MGTVEFSCDLSQQGTELLHCWEHTVGNCHAPTALRADWQQLLLRCHSELGLRHVRFHVLLSDDLGTVVKHKDQLRPCHFTADLVCSIYMGSPSPRTVCSSCCTSLETNACWLTVHETVGAWVARANARITVLLVNYALPRHSITKQRVTRQECGFTWRDERIGLELELTPHAVAALTVEFVP
jgi:hypothetical protein